jgi:hypothetical protein
LKASFFFKNLPDDLQLNARFSIMDRLETNFDNLKTNSSHNRMSLAEPEELNLNELNQDDIRVIIFWVIALKTCDSPTRLIEIEKD